MSKEDVHEIQKKLETYYGWQRGLSLICRIQCIKEHTVIARTVEILEKWNCSTENITLLKGATATACVPCCACVQHSTYWAHHNIVQYQNHTCVLC